MSREYQYQENPTGRDARFVGYAPLSRPRVPRLTRADRREYVRKLAEFPMFAGCSHDDLVALVDEASTFNFPPGWAVVCENTPSDSCYVVVKGEATVYRGRVPIAQIEPGSVIGEMSVLSGSLRRATVTTTTRMTGLYIDNEQLIKLLHKRESLLSALRDVFAARAAATGRLFEPAPLPARRRLGFGTT